MQEKWLVSKVHERVNFFLKCFFSFLGLVYFTFALSSSKKQAAHFLFHSLIWTNPYSPSISHSPLIANQWVTNWEWMSTWSGFRDPIADINGSTCRSSFVEFELTTMIGFCHSIVCVNGVVTTSSWWILAVECHGPIVLRSQRNLPPPTSLLPRSLLLTLPYTVPFLFTL